MNPERQRQHAAHKERRVRMERPVCRAIAAPVVREAIPPLPIIPPLPAIRGLFGQHDFHVRAWERSRLAGYKIYIGAIAEVAGVDVASIISMHRARHLARPRQIAMYLLREDAKLTFPDISRRFGGRDHTTALHGVNVIRRLVETDPEIAGQVQAARAIIVRMRGAKGA